MSTETSKNKCSHLNSKHFHMDITPNTSTQLSQTHHFLHKLFHCQMCFLSCRWHNHHLPRLKTWLKLFVFCFIAHNQSSAGWGNPFLLILQLVPPFTCSQSAVLQTHMGPFPNGLPSSFRISNLLCSFSSLKHHLCQICSTVPYSLEDKSESPPCLRNQKPFKTGWSSLSHQTFYHQNQACPPDSPEMP